MRSGPWTCFHCNETFTTAAAASQHFGDWEDAKPVCQFDAEEMQELQNMLQRYMDEDTELHREISRLRGEMQAATRRAEEQGYARGLRDARKHPETIGLRPA